jgi:transcriptional regulator with XRE-family HTH domain
MAVPMPPRHTILQSYFDFIWAKRPRDVEFRATLTIQMCLTILRDQTRLAREEFASKLGVSNSRLTYIESRGKLTEAQFKTLISLCEEFGLDNLAKVFDSKMILARNPHIRGNKTRGRRTFDE